MKAILNDSWRAATRNPSGANNVIPAPAYTDARRMVRRLSGVSNRSIDFMGPPVGFRGSREFADRGTVSKLRVHCNTPAAGLHSLLRATSPLIEIDGQD